MFCTVCNTNKPVEAFSKSLRRLQRTSVQHTCLSCQKDITNSRRSALAKEKRDKINQIKMDLGCVDCGFNSNPIVLHCDHRDPSTKSFNISASMQKPLSLILAEIDKCDIRCANCHIIKTFSDSRVKDKIKSGMRKYHIERVHNLTNI